MYDSLTCLHRYEKNKELGLRLGCWKGGQLVADDAGEVEKALAEQEAPAAAEATK